MLRNQCLINLTFFSLIFRQALIHVSTAYANCNQAHIDEKFYKTSLSGENAIQLANALDEKTLEKMTTE